MNIELLTEFLHEFLRYKDVKINSWKIYNRVIVIDFDNGFGEVVEIERYNKWLSFKRDKKVGLEILYSFASEISSL